MTSASRFRALLRQPFAVLVMAAAVAIPAQAAKPVKAAPKRVCTAAPCEQALAQLDRALSVEVAAAGRAGAQILLQQANDGRYKGSKVNAQIAAVHDRAAAGAGPWYLVHGKRTPQGGVEVKGVYALSAKAGKAASAAVDGMALELGNPQRPDVQPLATALSTLVGSLPAKPRTLPESQLPKWLGGSSLVAVAGYDAASGRLSHFAVVPDVIDVRMTGTAGPTPLPAVPPPPGPGLPPLPVGAAGPNFPSPNLDPSANKVPVATAIPPRPAAVAAATSAATAKGAKVRGQVISQRPGETIMLLSDEQGRPKGLQFDVDPVVLEQTQQREAQQQQR